MSIKKKADVYHGILFMALFACAAFFIGQASLMQELSFSPLIIGIVLGMIYANTLRSHLPAEWGPGIQYCSKRILRLGIILYGFRLTFQDVMAVGLPAIIVDMIIVTVTIIGGYYLGRAMKMDRDIAMLTSVGSGICGAAAVLGAEATLQTKPYKTAVAVATVVIFGTIAMFIYPVMYRSGILELNPTEMGIYSGSTLHEVAHAVGAGNAMGEEVAGVAIIVKMIRVMLLVPVLLVLGWWGASRKKKTGEGKNGGKVAVPWFAFGFLAVIGFNSLDLLPGVWVEWINQFDTFLLTMAMCALGAETSFDKFKKAGAKPFVLAACLFVWLIGGGYLLARYLVPIIS
ncbi:MAG: YeiH family putative sulfate export transporter [Bacteroides sp.]|nr:YeiH family putative sulfate export transporter [Bacteroidales bacterium]MBD5302499.1 YeiH family putative sulfate export transporter [Bacteroides sp.]